MGPRNEEEVTININPKSVFPFLKQQQGIYIREIGRGGGKRGNNNNNAYNITIK
jgi:hypothetical protein